MPDEAASGFEVVASVVVAALEEDSVFVVEKRRELGASKDHRLLLVRGRL